MALVLVIEDNQDVRENLEDIMKFKGFKVVSTDNAVTGINLALNKEPDLVISDIMMPEMDGYAFVKQLRNTPKISNIPVILLTAKKFTEAKIKTLDTGADH